MISPGLYVGSVMHRRLASPPHRFAYKTFWIALDLDLLEATTSRLRLFSTEQRNLFSFYARDHADGKLGFLRGKIEALCHGFDVSGQMILLTMPRMLGFVFNPLSVYFCSDSLGALCAIAWEVTNTFGARHTYVIRVQRSTDGVIRQACKKRLHVSPFLGMDLSYRFRVEASNGNLRIGIVDHAENGAVLSAVLNASRREMTDRALAALFLRTPAATLKVIAAIHWQALRLWAKGARFRRAPPGSEASIATHASSHEYLE